MVIPVRNLTPMAESAADLRNDRLETESPEPESFCMRHILHVDRPGVFGDPRSTTGPSPKKLEVAANPRLDSCTMLATTSRKRVALRLMAESSPSCDIQLFSAEISEFACLRLRDVTFTT